MFCLFGMVELSKSTLQYTELLLDKELFVHDVTS